MEKKFEIVQIITKPKRSIQGHQVRMMQNIKSYRKLFLEFCETDLGINEKIEVVGIFDNKIQINEIVYDDLSIYELFRSKYVRKSKARQITQDIFNISSQLKIDRKLLNIKMEESKREFDIMKENIEINFRELDESTFYYMIIEMFDYDLLNKEEVRWKDC